MKHWVRPSFSAILPLGLSVGLGVGLSGCPLAGMQGVAESCTGLPADQKESLMAPLGWSAPVEVSLDSRFTQQERFAIEEALEAWNAFGTRLRGRALFVTKISQVRSQDLPGAETDCDFDGSDEARFKIIKEDTYTRWRGFGLSGRNPAVTIRCQRGGALARQVVLINTMLTAPPQLTSVALHELGHAAGLDHSCELSGGTRGYAGCSGIPDEHPYRQAVMFPTLRSNPASGEFELKPDLRSNDRLRAACLYSGA
jgi:hypothetical protein